jgi:hypothetical protein
VKLEADYDRQMKESQSKGNLQVRYVSIVCYFR